MNVLSMKKSCGVSRGGDSSGMFERVNASSSSSALDNSICRGLYSYGLQLGLGQQHPWTQWCALHSCHLHVVCKVHPYYMHGIYGITSMHAVCPYTLYAYRLQVAYVLHVDSMHSPGMLHGMPLVHYRCMLHVCLHVCCAYVAGMPASMLHVSGFAIYHLWFELSAAECGLHLSFAANNNAQNL